MTNRRDFDYLKTLHDLAQELLTAESIQEMLDKVVLSVTRKLNGLDCGIYILESSSNTLSCQSYYHQQEKKLLDSLIIRSINVGEGVIGKSVALRETLLIPNVKECPYYIQNSSRIGSELCVPIIEHGNLLGVIDIECSELNAFSEEDVFFVESIAGFVGVLIKNYDTTESLQLTIEKLEYTTKQFNERSSRYQNLVDQAGDCIFIHDAMGRILEVNQQAILALGYSKRELLNKRVQELDLSFEHDAMKVNRYYKNLRPNEPLVIQGSYQRKDGSTFAVESKWGLMDTGKVVSLVRDVSSREAIKSELHSTKGFLQEIIDTSPDIIYVFDFKKNCMVMGADRLADLLHLPKGRFSSWQSVLASSHEDDLPKMEQRVKDVLTSKHGEIIRSESRFRSGSGEWIWLQNNCKIFKRDSKGAPLLEIGTLSNIGDRKKAEQESQHKENYYKSLVEYGFDGIALHNADSTITYVSPGTLRLLGYEKSEVIGQLTEFLVHPDDYAHLRQMWVELLKAPERLLKLPPYRLVRKDGTPVWVENTLNNQLSNNVVNGIVSNFRDITEQRRAEQEQKKRELYFRSLVENSFEGITMLNMEGEPLFISNSVARILGYEADEVKAALTNDLIYPDDLSIVINNWKHVLENPGVPYRSEHYRVFRKDRSVIWVEVTLINLIDDENVGGIISNFRDISHKKVAEESLFRISNYDELTQLPNRRFLTESLERTLSKAKDGNEVVTLLYIDIIHLNQINNALGHDMGDKVINHVAKTVQRHVGRFDLVARSGNDEFAVVLSKTDSFEASKIATNIIQEFEQVTHLASDTVKINVKGGLARFPADADNAVDLISKAEVAVNRVKELSLPFTFFEASDGKKIREKIELEQELIEAIQNDELELYYQPKVCLKTGKILSLEALLRWQHPTRGFIPPIQIITIGEESSLIHTISNWVIRTAAKQIREWEEAGIVMRVAINLSAKDLHQVDLHDRLNAIVKKENINPRLLEIEITESAAMVDYQRSIDNLKQISNSGYHIGLDDFGTGYSSISYLSRLPVDLVKIDRSFVVEFEQSTEEERHDKEVIISNIIRLAESFKLTSLIEGIETEEQFRLLQSLGCDQGQGYWFSRPKASRDIEPLLRRGFVDIN